MKEETYPAWKERFLKSALTKTKDHPGDFHVAFAISTFLNHKTRDAFPGVPEIAEMTGDSIRHVHNRLARLKDVVFKIERRGPHASRYIPILEELHSGVQNIEPPKNCTPCADHPASADATPTEMICTNRPKDLNYQFIHNLWNLEEGTTEGDIDTCSLPSPSDDCGEAAHSVSRPSDELGIPERNRKTLIGRYRPSKVLQQRACDFWSKIGRTDLPARVADSVMVFVGSYTASGAYMLDWDDAWRDWYENDISHHRPPREVINAYMAKQRALRERTPTPRTANV